MAGDVVMQMDAVSHSYRVGGRRFENGKHTVLDNVSLELRAGETLGLLGRNGSGKTTMLRLMAGILAPSRGRVSLAPGRTAALLTIGLGFKRDLSGRDNSLLAAILQGCSRSQAEAYLDEIRDFAELGESFEEPVSTYSAGMRARLGFATGLITHVDILLVDEVLSVGDVRFRKKAQAAMLERITGDQTVVFVSHMASQIQEVCDRAIWIDQGSIAAEGDVAEVIGAYQGA